MRRLDRDLSRVAERGYPLGADLLIDRLERNLAGEPDPIVVDRQRSGIMQTTNERTTRQPGPPTPRRGFAMALASFLAVVVVGGGILIWSGRGDDGGGEVAATTTSVVQSATQAPTTTQAPVTAGVPVGTFTFDGTWSYDGPSTLEAGSVTFSLVNTSSERVAVVSWFGLEGDELEAELGTSPVGADIGTSALAPPPPPSDSMFLVEAAPGETVSASTVLGSGSHLIDGVTMTAGAATHMWRVALLTVVEP